MSPSPEFSVHFALQPTIFEIKVAKNRKCTEWPQTDLEHLTVKSTLFALNTPPPLPAQILLRFALRGAVFKISHILYFSVDNQLNR